MKIKEGFVLREICGQKVVSGEGLQQVNFSKLVSLNETAAFIWESVQGKEFTPESVAGLLEENYEVEHERALADSRQLCSQWVEMGLAD